MSGRRSRRVARALWQELVRMIASTYQAASGAGAAAMEELVRARNITALVVAAPPRTLAELRDAFHADVKARIIAEFDKDLTKHPVAEIGQHLVG